MATDRQGCNLIDRLQVLVLASPEIAEPICIALEDLAQVECTRPSTKPGAHGYNLKWLSSVLFSETVASEDDDDVSLFAWSRFDVVILQDLWLAEYEEGHTRLEFAGRVFASWDDSRGNFSTKKIVLVTDPELFQRRSIAWTKDWAVPVPQEEAQRVFDPKNSIEFIPLSNGGRELGCSRGANGYRTRTNGDGDWAAENGTFTEEDSIRSSQGNSVHHSPRYHEPCH